MPSVVPDAVCTSVESLLPHRGRMLLVDQILDLDDSQATTLSVARRSWPLCTDDQVNPLILIEVVAQTAGVHNGLLRIKTRGKAEVNRGWLVGIKKAVFHVSAIPAGARITTTSRNAFVFDNLREIFGQASIDGRVVAEVTLQVVEAN